MTALVVLIVALGLAAGLLVMSPVLHRRKLAGKRRREFVRLRSQTDQSVQHIAQITRAAQAAILTLLVQRRAPGGDER